MKEQGGKRFKCFAAHSERCAAGLSSWLGWEASLLCATPSSHCSCNGHLERRAAARAPLGRARDDGLARRSRGDYASEL